jgi:sec-independent protein translocase protein TatC
MLRMSFLDHLEELRTRILHTLYGLVISYALCLGFAQRLFALMKGPFDRAVSDLPPGAEVQLIAITPVEQFHLIYIKLPLVAAIFVAAPWLVYQVWSFIAPGLYRRERRWAVPVIWSIAGLFIAGGLFGYFVAARFAFAFLLGLGQDLGIQALISIDSYFNTFISIMLGLGVVFQMPLAIFFLTLLRIVKPGFLLSNVRYAILAIFVVAAIITPTPDVFNMMIFATPMILLFYVGIGASYLLLWHRERRAIPWTRLWIVCGVLLALLLALVYYLYAGMGYRFIWGRPWLIPPS